MIPTKFILGALASASVAVAHMEMIWPYPFRSKHNPNIPESTYDYSMTAPLGEYPCKGYIDPSAPSVVSWSAGSTINYTLGGTATHGGGSCQIVMSYDEGKTWNVILSIMGGCVIESLTEEVTIPKEAPSGKALFGWNWFNLIGNREMYQNCAPVEITNGGSGLDAASFPAPFVANVDAAPGCETIEHVEVVFLNPGKNVRYGGAYTGTTPTPGAGITGTCGQGTAAPVDNSSTSGGNNQHNAVVPSTSSSAASSTASTAPVAGETLYQPPPSVSTSSTESAATAITEVNAAPSPSTSTQTGPRQCRRPSVTKRHERLMRRSAHERLVRRKVLRAEQVSA